MNDWEKIEMTKIDLRKTSKRMKATQVIFLNRHNPDSKEVMDKTCNRIAWLGSI